jgi:hypothetical protein
VRNAFAPQLLRIDLAGLGLLFGKARLSMELGELFSEEAQDSKVAHSTANMAEGPSLPLHYFLDILQTYRTTSLAASSRWTLDQENRYTDFDRLTGVSSLRVHSIDE